MLFHRSNMPVEAPLNPDDFPRVAKEMGFHFSLRRGRVDWYKIDGISIDRLVQERDLTTLQENLLNVVNYNLESEFDVKILDQNFVKLFKLAQLSVDYLQYSEQHLFNCIELLREQLAKSVKDIEKLNLEIKKRDEDIKCLTKKIKEKSQHESHHTGNEMAAYFKCVHCGKTFANRSYLAAHIGRRHASSVGPDEPEVNRGESESLHMEIKQLKERLNNTDRLLQNDRMEQLQSQPKEGQFEEILETLNTKYMQEIASITDTFQTEIQKLKDAGPNDNNHQELLALIHKQELEIQRLQDQVNTKVSPEVDIISGQLEAQEKFWKSRLDCLEEKYNRQIEEMKVSMNKNENQTAYNYETKIEELLNRTTKQDEVLKIQAKQIQQLCQTKITQSMDSNVTEKEPANITSTVNSNARAAFRNRKLKHSEDKRQERVDDLNESEHDASVQHAVQVQPKVSHQIETESSSIADCQQKSDKSVHNRINNFHEVPSVDESSPSYEQEKNVQLPNEKNVPEMKEETTSSSSDFSVNKDREKTAIQYIPTKQFERKNSLVNIESESTSHKKREHSHNKIEQFLASTDEDDIDFVRPSSPKQSLNPPVSDSVRQSSPKKSTSSPVRNQWTVVDQVHHIHSSVTPSNISHFDGWNKVKETKNIKHVQQRRDILEDDEKHLSDSSSIEDENSADEDLEETNTDTSLNQQQSKELVLHSVESLEKALAKTPQVLEEFKLDIKHQFDQRLRDFGVDPEWQGIPQATYKRNMETLKHHQSLTAKKYQSFFKIKQNLISKMAEQLNTSLKLDEDGSGDVKPLSSTVTSQRTKRFNKVVGNMKRKAFGIFDRTKQSKRSEHELPESSVNKRSVQNQKRKNVPSSHRRTTNITSKEDATFTSRPLTTSTPLKQTHVEPHVQKKVFSSSDDSRSSDEETNQLKERGFEKVQTLWPEIHTHPAEVHSSHESVEAFPLEDSPQKSKLSSQISKSDDFLHSTLGSQEFTKSALKSALSTGSLIKKRVLFTDQNTAKNQSWELANKSIQKSVQFDSRPTQEDPLETVHDSLSDWEPSSDEYEKRQLSRSTEKIHLSTKQSEKIARISRNIEDQLNRTRTKPPGGVEAIPQDTVLVDQKYNVTSSASDNLLISGGIANSRSRIFTESHLSDSLNKQRASDAVPVPAARQQSVQKKNVSTDDWDLDDLDDIMSD